MCRNQYGHPGPAIGYWPRMVLGHVYIVLELVGSTRLTFNDDWYYELCDLMTDVCSESRMRSRTWRGVSKWSRGKDRYIGRLYSDIGKVLSGSGIYRSTGELREFAREYMGLFGTNLLTQGPVQIVVFCLFQCFAEKEYQTELKLLVID